VNKLPSHLYLDEHDIPYEPKSFSPDTERGAANFAHVIDFSERQAVKTLIFQVDTGARNIKMADPDVIKETTGYLIGSIPAFGWQPSEFRSFLEASLIDEPILGTGAGQWGEEIMMTPKNLIKASNVIVVNLTDREKSVSVE